MQLTYKGSKAFNTVVGGCFSIVLILAFITIFAFDIHKGITNPYYDSSSTTNFTRYNNNYDPFVMGTENQTVAIALQSFMSRKNIDENFRVYFWYNTFNYQNATESVAVQAVKCIDMYAEEIEREWEEDPSGQSGFYIQEFNTPGYVWICPNTTKITVLNNLAPAVPTYVNF